MTNTLPTTGRLAGIDFGTVRIGIAICDPTQCLASPFENYVRQDLAADEQRFVRLVSEEKIVGFVVGLPIHTTGEESEKSREARDFADWLQRVTGVQVGFCDERYTTKEAMSHLRFAGMSSRKQKQRLDMIAAQILLASYLESSRQGNPTNEPLDDNPLGDEAKEIR